MEWYTGFIILLIVYALWRLAPLFKLIVTPLYPADFNVIERESIAGERLKTLDLAEKLLIKHGFKTVCYVKRAPIFRMFDWGLYGLVTYKASTNTWALAYVEAQQIPLFDWRLLVFTPNHSDHYLVTTSLSEFEPKDFPARYLCEDANCFLRSEQLDYHDRRIPLGFKSAHIEADQAIQLFENIYFSGFIETGAVVKQGSVYKLSFKKALALWRRISVVHKEILTQKIILEKTCSQSLKSESPPENIEYQYAEYLNSKSRNTQSWLTKSGFLLGGAALFGIAFGLHFSFDFALALILVLFIHEAGHLFGMWVFGYKNLQMFFIPLLGALVLGNKDKVLPWQEAVVLLLGPVPGYILGVWMLSSGFTESSEFLFQFAVLSIFINVLNLMPFVPLDGGKLISLALFNRLPKLQVVLHVLSILVAGYVGLSWGEPVGTVIAVLLIVALPFVRKESQLLTALLAKKIQKQDFSLGRILEGLKSLELWQAQPLPVKWALLDSLSYRIQHANASYTSMVLIFILWLGSLTVPAALSIGPGNLGVISNAFFNSEYQQALTTEELEQAYTQASRPEEQLDLAYQLAYRLHYDEQSFAHIWEDVEPLLFDERIDAGLRGQYLFQYSSLCVVSELDCQLEFLLEAVEANELAGKPADEQMPVLFAVSELEQLSNADRLQYISKGLDLAEKSKDAEGWYQEFALHKSRLLESAGRNSEAETILLELADNPHHELEFLIRPREQLIDFYFRQGRKQQAIDTVKVWVNEEQKEVYSIRQDYRYWLVWLTFSSDLSEAQKQLSMIKAQSTADKAELELGKLLLRYLDQGYLRAEDTKSLMIVLRRFERYEWYLLAGYLLPDDVYEIFGEDPSEYAYENFGHPWYNEMRLLINFNELRDIKAHILERMQASYQ